MKSSSVVIGLSRYGSVAASLLIFVFFWALDFPKPTYDDLFYTAPAMNLATGGDFSNPMLARQGFPSHYFFVYPPLHAFVLAGWLKVFGISAASMTAFPLLNLFLITLATISLLRRHGAPRWLDYFLPVGVTFALFPAGLRPEPLAIALVMTGFALADWKPGAGPRQFAAFLLIFLGASAAPRITMIAGFLAFYAGWQAWKAAPPTRWRAARIGLLGLGAALVAALTFLVLIDFRVREFLATFHFHSTKVEGKKIGLLVEFMRDGLGILQWPLVLLPAGFLVVALRRPKDGLSRAGICIACAFPFMALSGGVGQATLWWSILMMILLGGSLLKGLADSWRRALLAGAIMLSLLMADRKVIVNCYGLLAGNICTHEPDDRQQREIALAVKPTPEHPVLIDGGAARYLYDYRIPPGCLDLEFGSPFPGTMPGFRNSSEIRKGDIYLASPTLAGYLKGRTYLEVTIPEWVPFGLPRYGFAKYPRHTYVIQAEDCKASRGLPTGP